MKTDPLDAEMYPPFGGFPAEGIRFLKQLKKNNNREWFAKHKPEYEDFVKLPMQSLIASLRDPMARVGPEFDVNPKRSMFRIYRDTRFSNNKLPYKTHVAAVFHHRGNWQGSAGYYVHIEPGGVFLGGGIYMPDSSQLKKIRGAIAGRSEEFLSIVGDKSFKKQFGGLEGEKLRRNPLGYRADHPMIEWLKHKQFYTGVEWEEKRCHSGRFIGDIVQVYEDLLPLIRFLNRALGV
jgi:uncharacterized protein (TIGR02453 family)